MKIIKEGKIKIKERYKNVIYVNVNLYMTV